MLEEGHQLKVLRTPVWVVLLLFAILVYFPLFLNLGSLPLRVWDEARQAMNAYDMWRSGNILVTHYDGAPEMWSTKPPLLIWLQASLFALIGPGELALRLPAAIAALLIGWTVLRVLQKRLNAPWLGLIAALVLFTSEGFLSMHMARSGDYDTPVILFMMLSMWTLHRWSIDERPRDLILFFLFLALGVLTKSVQALLFLPGLLAYLLIERKLITILRSKHTWLGIGVFLLIVGGFYVAREVANPGYLEAVWMNELGGRYGAVLDGHSHDWDFYIMDLVRYHFVPWWILVPCGIVLGLAHRDAGMRRLTRLLFLVGACYLLVISTAETKIEWYTGPLYPIMAILVAIALYIPFTWLSTEQWSASVQRLRVLPYVYLFAVFVVPYSTVVDRAYFPREWSWEEEFYAPSHFLQDAAKGRRPLGANVLCYDSYNAHLIFYLKLLNDQGTDIQSISKVDLQPGQKAFASEYYVREYIEEHYTYDLVMSEGTLRIYHITGVRG